MDREIKFRGFDEENKVWRYGHFFETVEGIRRCYNIVEDKEMRYYTAIDSIGQFTGLKDKNGEEVYEGDVILIPDDYESYGQFAGEKREVFYNKGAFRLKPKWDKKSKGNYIDDIEGLTVIGNIYSNSELIKE